MTLVRVGVRALATRGASTLLLEKILRQKSSIFISDAVVAILELGWGPIYVFKLGTQRKRIWLGMLRRANSSAFMASGLGGLFN